MARLSWVAGSHTEINVLHRELNADTVTHLSTNRARRWLMYIEPTSCDSHDSISLTSYTRRYTGQQRTTHTCTRNAKNAAICLCVSNERATKRRWVGVKGMCTVDDVTQNIEAIEENPRDNPCYLKRSFLKTRQKFCVHVVFTHIVWNFLLVLMLTLNELEQLSRESQSCLQKLYITISVGGQHSRKNALVVNR